MTKYGKSLLIDVNGNFLVSVWQHDDNPQGFISVFLGVRMDSKPGNCNKSLWIICKLSLQ